MSERQLVIMQLYPRDMNIYGDHGNVLVLSQRAKWHGYEPKVISYNPGDKFPEQIDIIIGGGGQDSGQDKIQEDLLKVSPKLHALAAQDTPMLLICGLYQLFGHFFQTQDGHRIEGIGLIDVQTTAGPERLIGNITTHSELFGDIIGFENHSGQTFLGPKAKPFGRVLKGAGNNGQDDTEGARTGSIIGSYLHGSLLPKNPVIADWLIEQAATKKFGDFTPTVIDDRFAQEARKIANKRPR